MNRLPVFVVPVSGALPGGQERCFGRARWYDYGARHVSRGRTYQTRVSSAARPRGESVDLRLPTGGESLLRVVPILACCVVRVPVHGLERALRMKLGGRRDLDRTAQHRGAQPLNPGPRHQSARST